VAGDLGLSQLQKSRGVVIEDVALLLGGEERRCSIDWMAISMTSGYTI
jgi:hypothetical protein